MKEHPILFRGPMVRAILEGRKTQTRRVVKCSGGLDALAMHQYGKCPYGQPGDLLWVRETWCQALDPITSVPIADKAHYRADGEEVILDDGDGSAVVNKDGTFASPWRPSIHMPRWASRLTLLITAVRVQRVQEITEDNAKAEGVDLNDWGGLAYFGGAWTDERNEAFNPALAAYGIRGSFASLWDSINAKRGYSWESNPWVWAITFEPAYAESKCPWWTRRQAARQAPGRRRGRSIRRSALGEGRNETYSSFQVCVLHRQASAPLRMLRCPAGVEQIRRDAI